MNKFSAGIGLTFTCALLLTSCTPQDRGGFLGDRLAPCTAQGLAFADLPFKDWPATYHSTVNQVIEVHLETMQDLGRKRLDCTAADTLIALPASFPLQLLAATLPPWEAQEQAATLSELHAAVVLKEYVRVYECANLERRESLAVRVNERENGTVSSDAPASAGWERGPFQKEEDLQLAQIDRELAIARPALERTLDVLGSTDQLLPVAIETECIKRASLNLRNVTGLLSDVLSCSAKTVGKTSLRDLPPLNP